MQHLWQPANQEQKDVEALAVKNVDKSKSCKSLKQRKDDVKSSKDFGEPEEMIIFVTRQIR